MANQDNPISKTIEDVLGVSPKPRSFSEKVDLMRRATGIQSEHYFDVMRQTEGLSPLVGAKKGSQIAIGAEQKQALLKELIGAGRLPKSAEGFFGILAEAQGNLIYQNNSLFYSEGARATAMPLQHSPGVVSFGGSTRKVSSLLDSYGRQGFLGAFYNQAASTGLDIHRAITQTRLDSPLSPLLDSGVYTRGIYTPEAGMWTGSKYAFFAPEGSRFPSTLANYQTAKRSFNIVLSTGGRVVPDELRQIDSTIGRGDYEGAFRAIAQREAAYIDEMYGILQGQGDPTGYVFIKPEFLSGQKSKILLPGANLTRRFGSAFEQRQLTKGLYHLANIRSTRQQSADRLIAEGLDPFAPYMVEGVGTADMFSQMKMNIAVVDTNTLAESRLLFQEEGMVMTARGQQRMATQLPKGTLHFKSPSDELISAIETGFGVNVGAGNVQNLNVNLRDRISRQDWLSLRQKAVSEMTDREKALFTVYQNAGKYRGLFRNLNLDPSVLSKLEMSDSGIKLHFVTDGDVAPTAQEMITGGVRTTGIYNPDHPLLKKGMLPKGVLDNVDAFMDASTFKKTYGANVLLTNFIANVSERGDAEQIFREVFETEAVVSRAGKKRVVIPMIRSHDEALTQVNNILESWKGPNGPLDKRHLAQRVLEGTKVITSKMLNQGIKGVSIFGMGGGVRTDFMGDINLTNPLRFSTSKMETIASGARQLGYASPYDDPLFKSIASASSAWRSGAFGINPKTSGLVLGESNLLRRFSNALLANPGEVNPAHVVSLQGNRFSIGGQALGATPSASSFGHGRGGVPLSDLSNTVYGQATDMLYVDLGKETKLSILGRERNYRYLPIPLEYLRMKEGVHGRIIVNKDNPAHAFLSAIESAEFSGDPTKIAAAYEPFVKAIPGKGGLLDKSSHIVMGMGGRVRLTPQPRAYFSKADLTDPSRLFDSYISGAHFDEYLSTKRFSGPGAKGEVAALRKQVADQGFFYAAIGVDPMQRSEHLNVHRIRVDKSLRSGQRIGQVNMSMNPLWYLMTERDTDRDVANMLPLTGSRSALEDRIKKQEKLSRHFMWFYNRELMKGEDPASQRLNGLMDRVKDAAGRVREYFATYIGAPKSLGYTAVRASEQQMNILAGEGVSALRSAGVTLGAASDDMLSQMVAPFQADPEQLGVTQKLMQSIYQGAVQKGTGKGSLKQLGMDLVRIGNQYKGSRFDYGELVDRTTEAIVPFLEESGKDRAFMAMDYLVEKGMVPSASAELMKADLTRGATEALGTASAKKEVIEAQAKLMAQYLGPGMVLAASVGKSVRTPTSILRKMKIFSDDDATQSVLYPAAGITKEAPTSIDTPLGSRVGAEALDRPVGEATESLLTRLKSFATSTKGRAMGVGMGVGAVAGAAAHALLSNEAPMPREPDFRRPTDVMPEVYTTAPKLYGSDQFFGAPRLRAPERISYQNPYQFSSVGQSSITLRDRTSPMNPHLIEREMRNVARSDYNY